MNMQLQANKVKASNIIRATSRQEGYQGENPTYDRSSGSGFSGGNRAHFPYENTNSNLYNIETSGNAQLSGVQKRPVMARRNTGVNETRDNTIFQASMHQQFGNKNVEANAFPANYSINNLDENVRPDSVLKRISAGSGVLNEGVSLQNQQVSALGAGARVLKFPEPQKEGVSELSAQRISEIIARLGTGMQQRVGDGSINSSGKNSTSNISNEYIANPASLQSDNRAANVRGPSENISGLSYPYPLNDSVGQEQLIRSNDKGFVGYTRGGVRVSSSNRVFSRNETRNDTVYNGPIAQTEQTMHDSAKSGTLVSQMGIEKTIPSRNSHTMIHSMENVLSTPRPMSLSEIHNNNQKKLVDTPLDGISTTNITSKTAMMNAAKASPVSKKSSLLHHREQEHQMDTTYRINDEFYTHEPANFRSTSRLMVESYGEAVEGSHGGTLRSIRAANERNYGSSFYTLDETSMEAAEARVGRKIEDLEIAKKALLAVNTQLESEVKNQKRQLYELKKQLKSQGVTTSDSNTIELLSEESEKIVEAVLKEDVLFQKLLSNIESLIKNAKEALEYRSEHTAKVISEPEMSTLDPETPETSGIAGAQSLPAPKPSRTPRHGVDKEVRGSMLRHQHHHTSTTNSSIISNSESLSKSGLPETRVSPKKIKHSRDLLDQLLTLVSNKGLSPPKDLSVAPLGKPEKSSFTSPLKPPTRIPRPPSSLIRKPPLLSKQLQQEKTTAHKTDMYLSSPTRSIKPTERNVTTTFGSDQRSRAASLNALEPSDSDDVVNIIKKLQNLLS
ncbi:hypothetical protein AX774_g1788 [Zancudomyces culisetae]|uniref:Uncharacterized protein n=1 Tax=Zancudomyces culisetae TaxID=1213189 RepID=A0A1R1PL32_ZANCU|nr:hypothetical protein AX774_g4873 [Zancudomyces culisetae]OMH84690.1 hypothetical protein AX774_g1788 [Zancudomyces culisetae]|eukprot:OMH81674.1 hypothetical protein AX774_g4873 [Zancudomyces culisetae]